MSTTTWLLRDGEALDLNVISHMGKRKYVSKIRVIDETRAEVTAIQPCWRCGGAGGSNAWAHTGWKCYKCGGEGTNGTRTVKLYTQEALDKLNVTAEKRRLKREEKRQAKLAAEAAERAREATLTQAKNRELYPDAINTLLAFTGQHDFLNELQEKYHNGYEFTERMAEGILKVTASLDSRSRFDALVEKIEAQPLTFTPGRQAISGYILGLKWYDSFIGQVLKATIIDERGFRIFCSLPKGMTKQLPRDIYDNLDYVKARRSHVKFTLTLEQKDVRFMIGTRPGKDFTITPWQD